MFEFLEWGKGEGGDGRVVVPLVGCKGLMNQKNLEI